MAKFSYYSKGTKMPPKVFTELDTEICFVSQDECKTSSLSYQFARYGMDSLTARLEDMRSKFGYADCTGKDFMTLQNKYVQSLEYFKALPSEVRRKYRDNPEVFYESIVNEPEEAYKAGFISDELYSQYKADREALDLTQSNTTDNFVSPQDEGDNVSS